MRCHAIVWVFGLLLVLAAGATTPGTAASVVDIKLSGAYFSEPATLRIDRDRGANDANRTLWIEADGEGMYTASEITLNGANEKRLHQVMFKSLKAGHYSVRAQVRSSTGVRGVATREIEVIGLGAITVRTARTGIIKMRIATLATTICLTLLGTIALAQSVTYDYDRAANFSNYKTYAWTRGTELQDEFNHARVVRAIDAALAGEGARARGTKRQPRRARRLPRELRREPGNHRVDPRVGASRSRRRGGVRRGFSQCWSERSCVDISDARTGAIVWRSLASSDIGPTDKPESRDRKIAKATDKMFKNYPPKR